MAVEQWVKDITEKTFGKSRMAIGATLKHPDGRTVKITSGQYWGSHGLSNFWYWREVKAHGKLGRRARLRLVLENPTIGLFRRNHDQRGSH